MGERFEGLYLPPPSRPDKPLTMKTVIVPNSEYAEGRNVLLTTANSVYTVAFRHLVEQRPDWSWATIQIIEKRARERSIQRPELERQVAPEQIGRIRSRQRRGFDDRALHGFVVGARRRSISRAARR